MERILIDDAVTFRRGLADLLLSLAPDQTSSNLAAVAAALLSPGEAAGMDLLAAGEKQGRPRACTA